MPTIKDVAKLAGVSVSTVSLVLNGKKKLKMETRYKVLQAAKEIGYVPNVYARSLVTKKKSVIGVIRNGVDIGMGSTREVYAFNSLPNTYLADMLDVIVAETNKSEYNILLDWVCWEKDIPEEMWTLPSIMDENRIDGLIWAGGILLPSHLEKFKTMSFPIVLIGSRDDNHDWVDTDPEEGIYNITKFVLSCGHTEIAFINGLDATQTSARKMKGFVRAVNEANIAIKPDHYGKSSFSGQGGYAAMEQLFDRNIRPTAVITSHDIIATGVIRCLKKHGLTCPNDVSVTGFEDGILAEYGNPSLTTVYINKKELGIQGIQILINRIANPNAKHVKMIIPSKLIVRESVRNLNV